MTSPLPHRDLPRRMLAAVEVRVKMPRYTSKARARGAEAAEILGELRNIIEAYEKIDDWEFPK